MVKYNAQARLEWLSELADDFRLKSYGYFVGFTVLLLDEYLTIEDRKTIFLEILANTQKTLSGKDEMIDMSELNEDVDDDGQKLWSDRYIKRERLQNTLDYLMRILKGVPVETEPRF